MREVQFVPMAAMETPRFLFVRTAEEAYDFFRGLGLRKTDKSPKEVFLASGLPAVGVVMMYSPNAKLWEFNAGHLAAATLYPRCFWEDVLVFQNPPDDPHVVHGGWTRRYGEWDVCVPGHDRPWDITSEYSYGEAHPMDANAIADLPDDAVERAFIESVRQAVQKAWPIGAFSREFLPGERVETTLPPASSLGEVVDREMEVEFLMPREGRTGRAGGDGEG